MNAEHIFSKKPRARNWLPYLCSFIIPCLVFVAYFIYRGISPFGHSSILTVDLGQQYVDFFAFYRTNLFTHPENLLFTFSKGLGGTMIGTLAYYLTSPLNLIVFLFPAKLLPTAIFVIITIKIGLIGLTSYHYFKKSFGFTQVLIPLFLSVSFALSGFVVAYNFNLMWLDTVSLLPSLILQVDKLVRGEALDGKKHYYLLLVLLALWFTNFYTAYMAILFATIYFLLSLFAKNADHKWQKIRFYLSQNIFAGLLNAFLLIPTVLELLEGKAKSTENLFDFTFSFAPQNILAKFFSGSYDFKEMSAGMPNFYFGAILFVFLLAYFFSKKISLKERLLDLGLFAFLLLSLSFDPLILIWHVGQFPTWYPGRFSFVLSFFALILIAKYLKNDWTQSGSGLSANKIKFMGLILLGIITFIGSKLSAYQFLDQAKMFITIAFWFIGFVLVTYKKRFRFITPSLLLPLILLDLCVCLVGSLADITYQDHADYVNYTTELKLATQEIKKEDSSLYRIEKDFLRSDDDALSAGFAGVGQFNSVIEQNQVSYLRDIGLITNSNAFSNGFSTLVTDSLLGVKYYLTQNKAYEGTKNLVDFDQLSYRPDFSLYRPVKTVRQINLIKNPYALPFAFFTDKRLPVTKKKSTGRMNQEAILQSLHKSTTPYFTQLVFPEAKLKNFKLTAEQKYSTKLPGQVGTVTYRFTPDKDDAYYLSIPSWLTHDDGVTITVNNHEINNSDLGNEPKLINVAANQAVFPITITFTAKDLLNLNELYLYRFDLNTFKRAIEKLQKTAPKIKQTSATKLLTSTFTTDKKIILQTQIPTTKHSGRWIVTDNGKQIKTSKWNELMLSVPLTKGTHNLEFTYQPLGLYYGLAISLVTLVSYCAYVFYTAHPRTRKNKRELN